MAKYKDQKTTGPSLFVPKRKGESARNRHKRRLKHALSNKDHVAQVSLSLGLRFDVQNHGHHWTWADQYYNTVQWWPSSAKMIFNDQWKNGLHVHDYVVALEKVKQFLKDN